MTTIARKAENPEARLKELEKALARNLRSAKWVNQRFKLPDGAAEEIDEIIRISEIVLGKRK